MVISRNGTFADINILPTENGLDVGVHPTTIIRAVDETLLGVILVVAGAVSIAVAAWVLSWYRQRKLVQEAGEWLSSEARIESGTLEGTHETGRHVLPTFAFSYQVSGKYYPGRFALSPGPSSSKALVETMISRMIGRKLLIRYNPVRPEVWFIPDEFIDGYKVEQKIGSHVIHDYSPED